MSTIFEINRDYVKAKFTKEKKYKKNPLTLNINIEDINIFGKDKEEILMKIGTYVDSRIIELQKVKQAIARMHSD